MSQTDDIVLSKQCRLRSDTEEHDMTYHHFNISVRFKWELCKSGPRLIWTVAVSECDRHKTIDNDYTQVVSEEFSS